MLVTKLTSIHELSLFVSKASHVGDARHRVIESSTYHELDEPSRTRRDITNLMSIHELTILVSNASHVGDARYRVVESSKYHELDEPSRT